MRTAYPLLALLLLAGCNQQPTSRLAGDWYYQDGMMRGAGHRLSDGSWKVDVSIRFRPNGSIESMLGNSEPLKEEVATREYRREFPQTVGGTLDKTETHEGILLWADYSAERTRIVLLSREKGGPSPPPLAAEIRPWGGAPVTVPVWRGDWYQNLLYMEFVLVSPGKLKNYYEWGHEPEPKDGYTLARHPPKVE